LEFRVYPAEDFFPFWWVVRFPPSLYLGHLVSSMLRASVRAFSNLSPLRFRSELLSVFVGFQPEGKILHPVRRIPFFVFSPALPLLRPVKRSVSWSFFEEFPTRRVNFPSDFHRVERLFPPCPLPSPPPSPGSPTC